MTAVPDALARTLRLSRYVARVAHAHPEVIDELREAGGEPFSREAMRSALAGPPDALASRLRRLRERVMARLAHRDLNGLAPLDEVFETMTALADECIAAAADRAHEEAAARYGEPRDGMRLTVVALGKLGGGELNVSSDVDLVFLYAADGETQGARPGSHHEFFAAAGRSLIALLSEVTGEGQAFRVDMRLRPFGDSGPLVTSLAALEDYFTGHGRPWERYAWLKARVVAGPGEGVFERVTPFVYRRYLDYGMLESLRDMHGRIAQAAQQRRKADDIKVGSGGIREAEFAVQLFQMVRGGRDPGLRIASTRGALAAIGERGLIEPATVAALREAYEFLRKLEHRLQYYDDQQTQALPVTGEHRALIAESMDAPDWEGLAEEIARRRASVQDAFDALFERREQRAHAFSDRLSAWLNDPQASPEADAVAEEVAGAGIPDALPVARRLIELTRSRRYRSLSEGGRAKLERLLPAALGTAARSEFPHVAALRLLDLLEAIDRREAYFSLLLEFPSVLDRAARLFGRSAWAARLLSRHPILLDDLTRDARSFAATDWAAERAFLAAECAQLRGDVERLLDHLRHYKQRQVLRFVLADIEGELPVMALSDELSALADTILDVTVAEVGASFGFPPEGIPGFAVVGYGKLGGKELGYGSDLDIIFVYDEAHDAQRDKLARVAQRAITWITSLTPAGVLYETDLRLRPDGGAGLLVSSHEAFREYQLHRAWTWEHQALTRARACAGDRALGERFERLRDELLARPRDREKLFAEVSGMRRKMRQEQKYPARDLKHMAGGIIDLEFCVQALVLADGPRHPQLRENKGNHTLLKRAGELGLIDRAVAVAAADAYLAMRRRVHEAALNDDESPVLVEGELAAETEAVRTLWKALFG